MQNIMDWKQPIKRAVGRLPERWTHSIKLAVGTKWQQVTMDQPTEMWFKCTCITVPALLTYIYSHFMRTITLSHPIILQSLHDYYNSSLMLCINIIPKCNVNWKWNCKITTSSIKVSFLCKPSFCYDELVSSNIFNWIHLHIISWNKIKKKQKINRLVTSY